MTVDTTVSPALLGAGLLVARLVLGLAMAAHGTQKLFGWFGGHGLAGTAGFFENVLGFRPGRLFAFAAAAGEVGSGLLVALGFLGPVGPALMIAVMLVAMSVHWANGFFAMSNGIELTVLYSAGALALAFTGPGAFSLDALLGLTTLTTPTVAILAVVAAIVGGLASLALRRPAVAAVTGD